MGGWRYRRSLPICRSSGRRHLAYVRKDTVRAKSTRDFSLRNTRLRFFHLVNGIRCILSGRLLMKEKNEERRASNYTWCPPPIIYLQKQAPNPTLTAFAN